jgi:hypothetical protein
MDTRQIFRRISAKLLEDFQISGQINHQGVKGTFRESALRQFLENGRLPERYSIGSGEIIGPVQNVSKQCDLIVYDKLEGISLIFSDTVRVYPIEVVYGVVEVKSSLSKQELIKALENIRSVKALASEQTVSKSLVAGWNLAYRSSGPFGIVFSYQLGSNSIASLEENLCEWEKENHSRYWPNAIVVLDEGIIYHIGSFLKRCYSNEDMSKAKSTISIHYKKDTLFHFYSIILDLCSKTKLGPVEIDRYFDPAEQIGSYVVRNHNRVVREGEKNVYKFTQDFIVKVVSCCRKEGKITHKEFFDKTLGVIPDGYDEQYLLGEVYLYNPDNLQGITTSKNLKDLVGKQSGPTLLLVPFHHIYVDEEVYYFPWAYVTQDDLELIPGKTDDDL